MTPSDLLDVVQRLLAAAEHPDVVSVTRYDQAQTGVEMRYASGAKAFFVLTAGAKTEPADFPEQMPEWKYRALYGLRMLVDCFESAKPAGVIGWRTVAIEGSHLRPAGLEVRTDSGTVVLQMTAGGPMGVDSSLEDFADWKVPDLSGL